MGLECFSIQKKFIFDVCLGIVDRRIPIVPCSNQMVAHRVVVAACEACVVAVCFAGVQVEQLVAVRHMAEAGVAAGIVVVDTVVAEVVGIFVVFRHTLSWQRRL